MTTFDERWLEVLGGRGPCGGAIFLVMTWKRASLPGTLATHLSQDQEFTTCENSVTESRAEDRSPGDTPNDLQLQFLCVRAYN